MPKVLVACVDYPSNRSLAMRFVHERNKYYIKNGINVEVLSFSCKENYLYDDINVFSLETVTDNIEKYKDYTLICHAPNVRNHYLFLKKYKNCFKKVIFFFHGHEIVKLSETYPKEYGFLKKKWYRKYIQDLYDIYKLSVWKNYFEKTDKTSELVFVSDSLKQDFYNYVKIREEFIEYRCHIIHNCIGRLFALEQYDVNKEKEFDYITIRDDLDSPVYCIDLICQLARQNADKRFLIIGKGEFFNHYAKADNVVHIDRHLKHEELINYINISRQALMPTKRDSQGVMSCELATFGIPVITSDLYVCKEMFGSFNNVMMLNEKELFEKPLPSIQGSPCINEKFFEKNTIFKEIELIKKEG